MVFRNICLQKSPGGGRVSISGPRPIYFWVFSFTDAVFFCSFEKDFCDSSPGTDTLLWTRTDKPTPTFRTGPDKANAGNFFIFMESTDVDKGTKFS